MNLLVDLVRLGDEMVALAAARYARYILVPVFFPQQGFSLVGFPVWSHICGDSRSVLRPLGLAATRNLGYIIHLAGMYPAERMQPIPMVSSSATSAETRSVPLSLGIALVVIPVCTIPTPSSGGNTA